MLDFGSFHLIIVATLSGWEVSISLSSSRTAVHGAIPIIKFPDLALKTTLNLLAVTSASICYLTRDASTLCKVPCRMDLLFRDGSTKCLTPLSILDYFHIPGTSRT